MQRRIVQVLWVVAAVAAAGVGYQWVRNRITSDIYRDRLIALSQNYEQLRRQYNEAVKRTAVTELIVEGNTVSVAICTADGQRKVIETPLRADGELYVDYVVLDGRLWIRRVFDARTPPSDAVVIDPLLREVDWDSPKMKYGKAVYRRLGEGRWVVTVTGDGSLGLAQLEPETPAVLAPPPPVRDYPQIEREIDEQIDRIGIRDVLWRLAPRK